MFVTLGLNSLYSLYINILILTDLDICKNPPLTCVNEFALTGLVIVCILTFLEISGVELMVQLMTAINLNIHR